MFGIMFTPISSGTAAQLNTIHTVYALCDDNQNVHNLLPSDHLLCSVFTHFFFIQCPLLLKCWFFFSVLFLFTLLLKCWFFFSVLSSLGSLAQVIKLCSSFVYVCMLVFCFWSLSFLLSLFVLVLLCSVLCLLVFWLCLVAYIFVCVFCLLVFYSCLLTCFFVSNLFWRWFFLVTLSQQYIWHNMFLWSHTISSQYVPCNKSLCFEGVLFRHMINMFSWSHYPSNMLEGKTCGRTFYTAHTKSPSSYLAVSSRNWIDNMYTLSLIPNKKSRAKYLSEDDGDSI